MQANRIDIYTKKNGRDLYNSLSINDEVLNRYWNKQGKYESFSKFRDLNGFNNLQALEELTGTNKDKSLCAIGTNQIFKATRSDLNKDFETITIDFEDKAEAELYKDYLEKNLKTNSVMKPSFEIKDNQLEYTYCRVCLNEDTKKLYRTQKERLTLNHLKDNQVMNSVNENSLLFIQEIHKKDKERLFSFKAKDNVIGIINSNNSLGLNDPDIEQLKDNQINLVNEVKKEVKKEKLETRGSNEVNSNIKQEKGKDNTQEKIEKEVIGEAKDKPEMTSYDNFMLVQQKLLETKLQELKDNKDTVMLSYDNYIKDGLKHNEAISKLSKSYKNEYVGDFVSNNLKDRQLETQILKEDNQTLKKQVSVLSGNLNTMRDKTNELTEALEDNVNTINKLVLVNENLDGKLENSQSENKTLTEQNESLTKDYKLKANEVFDLTEENKALTEDHNKVSLENAELKSELSILKSELSNKDKELQDTKSINSNLENYNKDLKEQVSNLESLNAAMKEQEAIDKKEMQEMRAQLNKLQTENVVLETKIDGLTEENNKLYNTISNSSKTTKEESREEKKSKRHSYGIADSIGKESSEEETQEEKKEQTKTNTKRQKR